MQRCGPEPKYFVSSAKSDQMVWPVPAGISSVHNMVAPPYSESWMPRCLAYQALRALGSFALRKMPPIPVTRAIESLRGGKCNTERKRRVEGCMGNEKNPALKRWVSGC